MRKAAVKIAMTLPDDLYRIVEQVRKKTRKSRSAVVLQDALRYWLNQQEQAVLIREYEAGYRARPETKKEVKAAEAAAVRQSCRIPPVSDPSYCHREMKPMLCANW